MTTEVVSFDGTDHAMTELLTPTSRDELRALMQTHPSMAIRGSGLSYCLAGAVDAAPTLSTRGLDRILATDAAGGTVTVEAGVTMGALLAHLVSENLWFPVLPGHPHITVGGCVAFNTHGKTQHDIGQFVDHVVQLTLVHPDHGERVCSPTDDKDLFDLTVGGFGLTGWIVDVTLKVEPLGGMSLRRRAHRADDLHHAVEIMRSRDADGVHLYSWNDGNRRGAHFGRGVVYQESFVPGSARRRGRFRVLRAEQRGRFVPFPLWNRATTAVVNTAYFQLESRRRPRSIPVLDAAFPINGKEGYFHAYGRRGFLEYQLIVPFDEWAAAVDEVRAAIDATGATVPLTSLKLFRGESRHLWFRGDGVCLTIDGPASERTRQLFARLDELAIRIGAPVNLSKDSRLTAATVADVFPGYTGFKDELHDYDPAHRIDSALRRRIDV